LDRQAVEQAIRSEVEALLSGAWATGEFWRRVVVDGRTLESSAYTLTDNLVHIGTYYLVENA
jgi:hypothetical protein